jgi:hypothetical protein
MSTDQGATTRIGARNIYSSPTISASGPTPGIPTTSHGTYMGTSVLEQTSDVVGTLLAMPHSLQTSAAKEYKMCGQDKNTNGVFDTWIVYGFPDLTGAEYAGALATPLRDIFICG